MPMANRLKYFSCHFSELNNYVLVYFKIYFTNAHFLKITIIFKNSMYKISIPQEKFYTVTIILIYNTGLQYVLKTINDVKGCKKITIGTKKS